MAVEQMGRPDYYQDGVKRQFYCYGLKERTCGYQASGRAFHSSSGHLHGTTWALSFLEGYRLV